LDIATLVIAGVVAAAALATLVKALVEYVQQGQQKRADQFFELRRRFKESREYTDIAALIDLEPNGERLRRTPFPEKRNYLGLFEEIALVVNSGLIKPEVAHYMFGYYAVRCWESESFWWEVNRESHYWALFRDFVVRMKEIEQAFEFRRKDLRF